MRRAFTLMELLVVIAIIAILMALAFPVLTRARERAKGTQCISNLRQLGTAVETYVQDWDDRYPWAYCDDFVLLYNNRPSFRDVMAPMVKATSVWQCPSDIGEAFFAGSGGFAGRTPPFFCLAFASSYAYPGVDHAHQRQLAGKRTCAVRRPSMGLLLCEFRPWHGTYKPDENRFDSPARYNVLHCDGHISSSTWQGLSDDQIRAFYDFIPPPPPGF